VIDMQNFVAVCHTVSTAYVEVAKDLEGLGPAPLEYGSCMTLLIQVHLNYRRLPISIS